MPRSNKAIAFLACAALLPACAGSVPNFHVAPDPLPTVRPLTVEFCEPLGAGHLKDVEASRPAMMAPDKMEGDLLLVTADYAGGCSSHEFKICATEILDAQPVQVPLKVIHRSDDKCGRAVREKMYIDLAPLKKSYLRTYRKSAGAMMIELPNGELLYRFGH